MKLPYEEAMLILDEGYEWLDARLSTTKVNMYFSYVLFQSRKRGLDIYVTAQEIRTLDIRFKEMANIIVYCEKYSEIDNPSNYYYQYTFIVREILRNITSTFIMDKDVCEKIYPLYHTKDIIQSDRMLDMSEAFVFSNRTKLLNMITVAYNDIKGEINTVTKDAIETALLEHNYPTRLTKFIYTKMKKDRLKNKET